MIWRNKLDRRQVFKLSGAAALAAALPRPAKAAPLKLVFVHGRGQAGLNKDDIKATWLHTLSQGAAAIGKKLPDNLDVAFPFYGDVLDDFVHKSQLALPSDIRTKGGAKQDDYLEFQADMATEIRLRAGITDEQVDAEFSPEVRQKGPENWEWVQAIIRAIDRHVPGVSQDFLESFMRDVYLYTTNFAVQDAIDAIVAKEFTQQLTVVVGHSLGTVVAYRVLNNEKNFSVPLYVSVGCPLAIRAITKQLRPIAHPHTVTDWYNAFDKRDVVALYPLDGGNFPVSPPIVNYDGVNNQTPNRHGIVGYLNDKSVAAKILEAVGM
jgi:pimeloyl-ACP methyl ester carboxylesterase